MYKIPLKTFTYQKSSFLDVYLNLPSVQAQTWCTVHQSTDLSKGMVMEAWMIKMSKWKSYWVNKLMKNITWINEWINLKKWINK